MRAFRAMETEPTDGITVSLRESDIIDCVARGYLTAAHVRSAQRAIEALCAQNIGPFHRLYDGSEIEAFEPGLPIRWIRWSARLQLRGRVAIVGRPGPMLSVATTFRYLLPALRVGVFGERAAAIAFLMSANDAAPVQAGTS